MVRSVFRDHSWLRELFSAHEKPVEKVEDSLESSEKYKNLQIQMNHKSVFLTLFWSWS